MPEQEHSTKPSENQKLAVSQPPQVTEHFMATAMQIMNSNQYTPTQGQVDKMLALQEKGMDYTHKERTNFTPHLITTICGFAFFTIIIVGLFIFCIFYAPQYASQILSGAIGLLTGGIGGYGYANKKNKQNED